MDPDATLADIQWELDKDPDNRKVDEVLFQLADLRAWIVRGGFEPDWRKAPMAAQLYRTFYGTGKER